MVQTPTDINTMITAGRIVEIGTFSNGPCVSVHTPLVKAGPQTRQNEIRLSNQAKKAEQLFVQLGLESKDARRAVEPLSDLNASVASPDWVGRPGVVTFLNTHFSQSIAVPLEIEEMVIGGPKFITRYLLPFINVPSIIYVLMLSLGETKLFAVSRNSQEEVRPEGMPANLDELAQYEDPEKSVQRHGTASSAVFHGHGAAKDSGEELAREYVRQIATSVDKHLGERAEPLLLAATDEIAAEFRRFSSHPNLVASSISGNIGRLSPAQVRDLAWPVIDAELSQMRKRSDQRFYDAISSDTQNFVKGVRSVLEMAHQGRVHEFLFLDTAQAFGAFDPQGGPYIGIRKMRRETTSWILPRR
jgi:hypothetical protein